MKMANKGNLVKHRWEDEATKSLIQMIEEGEELVDDKSEKKEKW